MLNDNNRAGPLMVSSRDSSRTACGVQASMPAAGEPLLQDAVVAYDSACNCILELLALMYIAELHDGSPTAGHPMESESGKLVAELRTLHVGETAEFACTHRDYRQCIRDYRRRVYPALPPPSRKDSVDYARGSVRFEGFVLSPEAEDINCRYIAGELTLDEFIEAVKTATLKNRLAAQ
ncbi:antitoxin VbhA family protein [Cupriavidus basilensis]|uniref:antitoxin VbhA family protein n=1 Tax=Cupriavidus basilensis TaxID=68895 RepID=UPI0020A69B0E|nr:antitoxin VbhA family protein [Cupriavidus basilensis]MCP3023364.1 antitoxin VbhA family protein [Cupriavidus basilensis]